MERALMFQAGQLKLQADQRAAEPAWVVGTALYQLKALSALLWQGGFTLSALCSTLPVSFDPL